MNTHFKTALILVCFFLSAGAFAQTFAIEKEKSNIHWTGKAAFNSYSLKGSLKISKGHIEIENNKVNKLNIVVDMSSLDHSNKRLKSHLRSKDFFQVKKYKTAHFSISNPIAIKDSRVELTGTMKIKNAEKSEAINAILMIQEEEIVLNFSADLDRTKYGITYNSPNVFKKLKENAIADHFNLSGILTFQKE